MLDMASPAVSAASAAAGLSSFLKRHHDMPRRYPVRRGADAAVSACPIAGAPVALVDDARAERPGLDQLQPNLSGDRGQKGRAAADEDRIAEHAQLVDEAQLDRCGGKAGAADPDVQAGRSERRGGDLLRDRRLGEPSIALDAVERAAEDDLRKGAGAS